MNLIRIQLSRKKGWKMPDNTVNVDRSTGFGNPFPVVKGTSTSMGKTTDVWIVGTFEGPGMWFKDTKAEATDIAVKAYRAWLMQPGQKGLRGRAQTVLRGKNVACWCALGKPCHADALLEVANSEATPASWPTITQGMSKNGIG
jgi:hypothetical protein